MIKRVGAVFVALLMVGCGNGASGHVARSRSDAPTPSGAPPGHARDSAIHHVAWTRIDVPGEVCGVGGNVRLHPTGFRDSGARSRWGEAKFRSPRGYPNAGTSGPRYLVLADTPSQIAYGDVNGDGADEAALPLACNNNGGTADGAISNRLAVYSMSQRHRLRLMGLLGPRIQYRHRLPTQLFTVAITSGRVVVHEVFWGACDGTADPSGRATSVWTFQDGGLRPSSTTVTRRGTRAPCQFG
jgi:hypothetical protein